VFDVPESFLDRFYTLNYPYLVIFKFFIFLTSVRKIWTIRITADVHESVVDRFYTLNYPYSEIFIFSIFLTCVTKIWTVRITSDVPENILDRFYALNNPFSEIFIFSIFLTCVRKFWRSVGAVPKTEVILHHMTSFLANPHRARCLSLSVGGVWGDFRHISFKKSIMQALFSDFFSRDNAYTSWRSSWAIKLNFPSSQSCTLRFLYLYV